MKMTFKYQTKHLILFFTISYALMFYFGLQATSYNNDEYFYLMMGREILDGKLPYRDFFSAHMPLMLYPIAASFWLFGVSVASGKIIPLAASIFIIYYTYMSGEAIKKGAGKYAALIIFISPMFQLYSHAIYGVSSAAAAITAAIYYHLCGRKKLSGFLAVVSAFIRLNTAPISLALFLLNMKDSRFIKGMLYASPLLAFFAVPNFFDQTIAYHLLKTPHSTVFKIKSLYDFFVGEWLLLAFASYCLLKYRKEKSIQQLSLMAGLFFGITTLSKTLFSFYYFVGLPALAIASGYAIKRNTKHIGKICAIIILWVLLGAQTIMTSYSRNEPIDHVVGLISQHASGESFFCMSLWCPYMAFKSGAKISGNLIDMADPRIETYSVSFQESLFSAARKDNSFVLLDLKEANMYSKKFKLNITDTVEHIFENYSPIYYLSYIENIDETTNWWSSLNLVIFLVPNSQFSSQEGIYPPNTSSTVYLREEYLFLDKDLNPHQAVFFRKAQDIPHASFHLPKYLTGANRFNLTVLSAEALIWPLTCGGRYVTEVDGIKHHVWVSPKQSDYANVFVISRDGDDILAFTQLTYDTLNGDFTSVRVHSRISEIMLTGYMPTYTQTKIDEEEYLKLKNQPVDESFFNLIS
jgi:hypothetical protein